LGKKKAFGYTFISYKGDHPPLHVHIYRDELDIGRWSIECQRPMDEFLLGRNLRKALVKLGYLLEDSNGEN